MARFTVFLLLMPSLLLSQLAAAPHGHGSDVHYSGPHGNRPHVHFHHLIPFWPHEAESHARPDPGPPAVGHECPCEHDADAVYLPDTSGEAAGRDKFHGTGDSADAPSAALLCADAAEHGAPARVSLPNDPAFPSRQIPLYIYHCALLN